MDAQQLRTAIRGDVIAPGDSRWDSARLFHSGIGSPDLIVRPRDVADVAAAVRTAADAGSSVGVRGGGHSAWGTLSGGVVLDLVHLGGIEVAEGRRVGVGGGATWGAVARTLAPRGLAVSSGDTGSVGVGGLTLGGGIGWMVRAWGLAADQLVGAQVVTAAGEVVEASAESVPELFWALRGGGGNFGVVTRFDFAAHELTGVVFATYRVSDATATLRVLRDILRDAPLPLTVTYMDVPPVDPSAPAGASVTACWAGTDVEAVRAVLAPLATAATEEEIGVRAYPDILLEMPAYDPEAPPPGFVGGNTLLTSLTDDAIDRLVAFRRRLPASVLFLRSLGGAYGAVDPDATAFSARSATWFAMAGAFRIPGMMDDEGETRVVGEWDAIEALGIGSYGNFSPSVDRGVVRRMYPDDVRLRLARVKRAWDPGNVFSHNHNIAPA